jgi:hypothetical protein
VISSRLRIIVLGFLIREPTGGQAWHYLNYVQGLAELGHDVYYIEDSDDTAMCFSPTLGGPTNDPTAGLQFASEAFSRLGLGDRWAYYDAHTDEWKGPRAYDARTLCESADLVLNVSGVNPLRSWLETIPVRAMIDTDPGFTQVRNLTDPVFRRRSEIHTAFFSFGENVGMPCCRVPDDGFPWQSTRQPVALTAWPYTQGPRGGQYSTVMQWESFRAPCVYAGLRLAMKSESFQRFIELPKQLGRIFDLAIRSAEGSSPNSLLSEKGWGIADIEAVSRDPWTYQSYIRTSRAEFGVAKAGYAVTDCGWFSERSAVYLASGRPVLHQDTGFPAWLPCGEGVFPFSWPEDVADAVARIESNYERHCYAARDLAMEYFSAPRVLPSLIEAAMAAKISIGSR